VAPFFAGPPHSRRSFPQPTSPAVQSYGAETGKHPRPCLFKRTRAFSVATPPTRSSTRYPFLALMPPAPGRPASATEHQRVRAPICRAPPRWARGRRRRGRPSHCSSSSCRALLPPTARGGWSRCPAKSKSRRGPVFGSCRSATDVPKPRQSAAFNPTVVSSTALLVVLPRPEPEAPASIGARQVDGDRSVPAPRSSYLARSAAAGRLLTVTAVVPGVHPPRTEPPLCGPAARSLRCGGLLRRGRTDVAVGTLSWWLRV